MPNDLIKSDTFIELIYNSFHIKQILDISHFTFDSLNYIGYTVKYISGALLIFTFIKWLNIHFTSYVSLLIINIKCLLKKAKANNPRQNE